MGDILSGHWTYPLLAAVVVGIIGWYAARFLQNLVIRTPRIDDTLSPVLSSVARYATLGVTILVILSLLGIDTTNVVAMLGVAGLAIGLALKDTLQNIASGIVLLVLRPFRVGDFIECDSISGTVQAIHIFATELLTGDGIKVVIPNSSLWGGAIKNFTINGKRRIEIRIGIDYGDDPMVGLKMLSELAAAEPRILADPAPQVMVTGYGESSIDLMLRCWTVTDDFWATHWDLQKRIKPAFDEAGLSIPFPQRDLHIIPADMPAAMAAQVKAEQT